MRMRLRAAFLSSFAMSFLASLYFFPNFRLFLFKSTGLDAISLARIFGLTALLIVYNAALYSGVGFVLVSRLAIGWICLAVTLELIFVVPGLDAEALTIYVAFSGVKAVTLLLLFSNLREWRRAPRNAVG